MSTSLDSLARRIVGLERELAASRTPQLAFASVDVGEGVEVGVVETAKEAVQLRTDLTATNEVVESIPGQITEAMDSAVLTAQEQADLAKAEAIAAAADDATAKANQAELDAIAAAASDASTKASLAQAAAISAAATDATNKSELARQLALAAATLQTNLASNPSGEVNATNWAYGFTATTISRDTSQKYSGTASIKGVAQSATMEVFHQSLPTAVGKTYTVAAMVRASGSFNANLTEYFGSTKTVALTTSWQRVSFTFTCGVAGQKVGISSSGRTAGDAIWVDDFIIVEGSTIPDYWDGSTPADSKYAYGWTGTAHASTSQRWPVLANSSVTAATIAAGAVIAGKLATDSVLAANIKAGEIATNHLAALSVTAAKVAANAITSDKIEAGAVIAGKLAADSVLAVNIKANQVGVQHIIVGDLSNMASIDGDPTACGYAGMTYAFVTGPDSKTNWIGRTAGTPNTYMMFRPQTGPVPLIPGDRVRVVFEGCVASGTTSTLITRVWAYGGSGSAAVTLDAAPGSPTIMTTTPQTFAYEGVIPASFADQTSYLVGTSTSSFTTMEPRVRNVRAYRMGAGELIVDGSIVTSHLAATAIDGMTITGALIRTAASGPRLQLNTDSEANRLSAYTGRADETSPASITAETWSGGIEMLSATLGSDPSPARLSIEASNGVGQPSAYRLIGEAEHIGMYATEGGATLSAQNPTDSETATVSAYGDNSSPAPAGMSVPAGLSGARSINIQSRAGTGIALESDKYTYARAGNTELILATNKAIVRAYNAPITLDAGTGKITLTGSVQAESLRPQEYKWTTSTGLNLASGTYVSCGTYGGSGAFVAPASGSVAIEYSALMKSRANGNWVGTQGLIRTGGTVGMGTLITPFSTNECLLVYTVELSYGTKKRIITGLTPGATYNVEQIAVSQDSTAGAQLYRGTIIVTPLP